jgi:hypothetical protein
MGWVPSKVGNRHHNRWIPAPIRIMPTDKLQPWRGPQLWLPRGTRSTAQIAQPGRPHLDIRSCAPGPCRCVHLRADAVRCVREIGDLPARCPKVFVRSCLAPGGGGGADGPLSPRPGGLRCHQPGLLQAADRVVDDRPGNVPDPAYVPAGRGGLCDGESAGRVLADRCEPVPRPETETGPRS